MAGQHLFHSVKCQAKRTLLNFSFMIGLGFQRLVQIKLASTVEECLSEVVPSKFLEVLVFEEGRNDLLMCFGVHDVVKKKASSYLLSLCAHRFGWADAHV